MNTTRWNLARCSPRWHFASHGATLNRLVSHAVPWKIPRLWYERKNAWWVCSVLRALHASASCVIISPFSRPPTASCGSWEVEKVWRKPPPLPIYGYCPPPCPHLWYLKALKVLSHSLESSQKSYFSPYNSLHSNTVCNKPNLISSKQKIIVGDNKNIRRLRSADLDCFCLLKCVILKLLHSYPKTFHHHFHACKHLLTEFKCVPNAPCAVFFFFSL